MVEQIFFQSSMPRSGSTMFSNILAQNPDFYVTPTSGVLELVFAARENYTNSPEFKAQKADEMRKGFIGFCNGGINGFFNSITDKKYVLDKSRGWGIHRDFLNAFYPDPKIICVVRDLRDIIASMEKNFRKGQLKSDPTRDHSKAQGTHTGKRIDNWMAFGSVPVGMALERLNDIITQGYDNKIHFVKYEDLCLYPEQEMQRMYHYLGVPNFKHDFDNIEQVTVEDDEVYGAFGDHTIRKKLQMKPSDATSVLTKRFCDIIYDNHRWYFDKFNYRK
jgi:sulfotransferase